VRALITIVLFALACGSGSAQAAGEADPSFGHGGRLMLPSHLEEGPGPTLLADGRVVFAGYKSLLALLPSGEIDSGFGEGGRATPLLPPGATDASIAAVLVDSQGRLLLVGGCTFPATGGKPGDGYRSEVLVERFSADGRLDRSFAAGRGFATTDFDLPPAESEDAARVWARSAALDAAGRILISGDRAAGKYFYKGFQLESTEGFVARLTSDGQVDPAFAGRGVLPIPGRGLIGSPAVDREKGLYLVSEGALLHLRADGAPDPAFGQNGGRPLPHGTESNPIVDPTGGILVSGYLQGWKDHRLANGVLIRRLQADGRGDRGFGHNGEIAFRLPRLYTARVGVDSEGRVLVAAALKQRPKLGRRLARPAGLALARLLPGGRLDGSFGQDGVVRIPFPGGGEMNVTSLQLLGEEALLGATWCNGRCGEALARVRLGSG
jgi:uncharacterized delta-60 repeat protein